jgi:hypothetical protein
MVIRKEGKVRRYQTNSLALKMIRAQLREIGKIVVLLLLKMVELAMRVRILIILLAGSQVLLQREVNIPRAR